MNWAGTGTRPPADGFTQAERALMLRLLIEHTQPEDSFGCGGCVGVDGLLGRYAKILNRRLVLFLPAVKAQVDMELVGMADEIRDGDWSYLQRDQLLVDWCDKLLAVPLHEENRQARSGTWATVRMARRAGKIGAQPLILRPKS